jgi:peroxiredoxin
MKLSVSSVISAALLAVTSASAAVTPGQSAPAFSAIDISGKPVKLADFSGRYVVLEWNNPNCPFVRKHYDSANMQSLQKRFGADKVAWIAVNSTSEAHSDYMTPEALAAWFRKQDAAPTAVVLDSKGELGRAFGAKVTPHMYVIDPKGTVIYAGAIDDRRSANPADVKLATNYVAAALTESLAGRPVANATSTAYGCTIKY